MRCADYSGLKKIDLRAARFRPAKDQLTLGRLWHNRITGTPEDQITDGQAMTSSE
jgi:hypothetical protein